MRLTVCVLLMLLWVSALLLTPGCGPDSADASQANKPRPLTFTVVNRSGFAIKSVALGGANMPMAFRDIGDGGTAMLKNKDLKLPETLSLHWTDSRGDRHEGRVKVWRELGASYSGDVRLTISRQNKVTLTGG